MTTTPFSQQIAHMAKGTLDLELTEELAELVKAIQMHGKKGSITLLLDLKPQMMSSGEVHTILINPKITTAQPQPVRMTSQMFPTGDGDLLRNDPDQGSLDLKTVDTETGEIKEL